MNRSFLFLLSGLFLLFMSASIRMVDATETACTMEYVPVCGMVPVQCVRAPCLPIEQTFGNMCVAQSAGATNIRSGECDLTRDPPALPVKMSPRVALQAGSWTLVSYNGKTLTQSGTLTFENGRFHAKLCNVMNGRYNVTQRGHLVTRQVISTKMYCEGEIMSVEQAMAGGRYTFSVGADTLTVMTRQGDTIVWKR